MASKQPKTPLKTPNTPSLCNLVHVEWSDAAVSIGWDEGKANARVEAVKSVGWLLASDDHEVVLGADTSMDEEQRLQTNRRIAIPKPWIKSITEIKV